MLLVLALLFRPHPHHYHGTMLFLPCSCHALPMLLPCSCRGRVKGNNMARAWQQHSTNMTRSRRLHGSSMRRQHHGKSMVWGLPCSCPVLPCSWHALAMVLPCSCPVIALFLPTRHATRHTPHATRHTPQATHHTPHATRHTPYATLLPLVGSKDAAGANNNPIIAQCGAQPGVA
jgi:hypothetical protein